MVRTETDAPVKLRRYRPEDCGKLAELFYETVHFVNAADYTKEQLDVWAPKQRDLAAWNASLLSHYTLMAEMGTEIVGFGDMDENGYLDRLYVRWDCQKRGIARRHLQRVGAGLRQREVYRLRFHYREAVL